MKAKRMGSRKRVRLIALLASVAFVAFAVLLATRKPVNMQSVASPLIGKPAPAITATTLSGHSLSLNSYRGRFVLLNFFASWCTPCHAEEQALVQFSNESNGTSVVGVAFNDVNSSASAFLKSFGATFPAATDPRGQIALAYGVAQPPQTYLIAPNGAILSEIIGPINLPALNRLLSIAKAKGY